MHYMGRYYASYCVAIRSNLWRLEKMTALTTSLALPLFNIESAYHEPVRGFKILILLAIRKCMKEQYWTKSL